MSDDQEFALTAKGMSAAIDILERFRGGERIEHIAASYDMPVDAVRLLMTMAHVTGVID